VSSEPWLQVEFGNDVKINTLQTAGVSGDGYVSSFEIHTGNNNAELTPLAIGNFTVRPSSVFSFNAHVNFIPIQVIERPQTADTVNHVLPSPVTTRVLRIVFISWSPEGSNVCFNMEALGCLAEPSKDQMHIRSDLKCLVHCTIIL